MFDCCIKPDSLKYTYDDGKVFVKTAKLWNGVHVRLRTKGNHGPTFEIYLQYPRRGRNGEIEKIRIIGKLVLMQLLFRNK